VWQKVIKFPLPLRGRYNGRMSDKLINTFHMRRKLNADIEALGETSTEAELYDQVRAIIHKYEPDLILATLRKFLDTSSSQLRGGLGRLATLLPYEEVSVALRHEAANRSNPTPARLTAALILERFLDVDIPPAIMSDLKDPEFVVMQSLKEAVTEGRENRYVLLDYVRQMRLESEEIAYMVQNLIDKLPPEERPDLLRLIAYDTRSGVAQSALDRLAALRQPQVSEQGAEALYTLQANLSPKLAEWATRSLRKLRFSGLSYEPPPMEGWRALLTPCSLSGDQDLWFLRTERNPGTLLGLQINVGQGLFDAFGSDDIELRYLPPVRPVGEMISIAMSNGTPTVFLEVPVAYARWHLQQILAKHWQQSPLRPLPDEYTLHNIHLFRHASGEVDAGLVDLLAAGPTLWAEDDQNLAEVAAEFLRHPAMASWFFQEQPMKEALLRTASATGPVDLAALVQPLIDQMFADQEQSGILDRLQAALYAQAGWLSIAGHERTARNAVLLAESLRHMPLTQHPLIALMVEVGLMLLLNRRTIH
jgi:hypothetical protein